MNEECSGKKQYTKREAQENRNYRRTKGWALRIYQCPQCNWWHLARDIPPWQ